MKCQDCVYWKQFPEDEDEYENIMEGSCSKHDKITYFRQTCKDYKEGII